jgi:hypothetical protein
MFVADHPSIEIAADGHISVNSNDLNAKKQAELLNKWRRAVLLPNVNGPQDLHAVFSFLPDIDICAVLEGPSGLGELALFGPTSNPVFFYGSRKQLSAPVRRFLGMHEARSAWLSMQEPGPGYRWNYFAINPGVTYQKALAKILGPNLDQFKELRVRVEATPDFREIRTKGVDNGARLSAIAYFTIVAGIRGYVPLEDDEQGTFERMEKLFVSLSTSRELVVRRMPDLLSDAVRYVAGARLEAKASELVSALEDAGSEQAARIVMDLIWADPEKKAVEKKLTTVIQQEITEPLIASIAAKHCTNAYREKLDVALKEKRPPKMDPLGSVDHFSKTFGLLPILRQKSDLFRSVDEILQRNGFRSFADIVEHYTPKWVQQDDSNFPKKLNSLITGLPLRWSQLLPVGNTRPPQRLSLAVRLKHRGRVLHWVYGPPRRKDFWHFRPACCGHK